MIQANIRNFCIIAHVDHGKSTLADRMLELTKTVEMREMKEQLLDQMDLERERGITIKLQPVRMQWQGVEMNLIDTPGHVDFAYEVSRSLAAVEGAVLLVDASQGIQAQTLANLRFAREHNLVIIPVMNKIDLPSARPEEVALQVKELLQCTDDDILFASGKTGEGVTDILDAVIARIPAPSGQADAAPRALIFDSIYDPYRGVVIYVRVADGRLQKGDRVRFLATKREAQVLEVGSFRPSFQPEAALESGEIGYVITDVKAVREARVGDTLALSGKGGETTALPGYREPLPMVYAGLYPAQGEASAKLRDALDRLKLQDASLSFEPEFSPALGFGFRAGFLGMLHLDIVRERLERHFDLDLIITTPSVPVEVVLSSGEERIIQRASELPSSNDPSSRLGQLSMGEIVELREPWVAVTILTPEQGMGGVLELLTGRRGILKNVAHSGSGTVTLETEAPLLGVIVDFADKLKSLTQGYASFDYHFIGFRAAPLARLDVLIASEPVDALAQIVHRDEAKAIGERIVTKLKEAIPRQQFVIKLQAAIGATIVAREDIPAVGKNVTAKLYGGDVTRKNKLLDKQKKGKKRLQQIGKVAVPNEAFLALLSR